jgi:hypothetical protein
LSKPQLLPSTFLHHNPPQSVKKVPAFVQKVPDFYLPAIVSLQQILFLFRLVINKDYFYRLVFYKEQDIPIKLCRTPMDIYLKPEASTYLALWCRQDHCYKPGIYFHSSLSKPINQLTLIIN